MRVRGFVLGSLGLALMGSGACAATSGGSHTGAGAGANGTGGQGASGGAGGQGVHFFDAGHTDGEAGLDPDAACGFWSVDAKTTPAAVYIAVGKNNSMTGTKWNGAVAGLKAFVADPASTGLGVALNFFPLDNNPTCDQFAYEPPVVPFGVLPTNAAALDQALTATMPNGFSTPIYPALGGAILASLQQVQNNPGSTASTLLVTDGQPVGPATTCGSVNPDDPQVIADLAATGAGMGIKTFVIGLPGVNQAIANKIAAAGGTTSAILVTITNVQAEFQQALAQVRGSALPCTYELPAAVAMGQIDINHVNVQLTPNGGSPSILPQDPACKGMGWKYDNAAKPTAIVFCPATCTAVKASVGGNVQIALGCATVVTK